MLIMIRFFPIVTDLCVQQRLEELCLLPFSEASDTVAKILTSRAGLTNIINILEWKEPNYYEVL